MRASQEAEERENARKQRELEDEDAILRQSQADHEAHEDQLAIIQAEEEQAILEAIRESEREAARKTAAKGKQTATSSSSGSHLPINSAQRPVSSSSSRTQDSIDQTSTTDPEGDRDDDDEDIRKALELSMLDQEDEQRQQEELFKHANTHQQSSSLSNARASTSALPQDTTTSSPSRTASTASRPPPPHLLPPRPGQLPRAEQPPSSTQANAPTLPVRRRLSEDSEYQSILDAPPPAYEASSTAASAPPSSQAHQLSPDPSSEGATGTYQSAVGSSETAQEEARALEEKRQVFYPPVATSEMAEGVSHVTYSSEPVRAELIRVKTCLVYARFRAAYALCSQKERTFRSG